jgi:AcrR family transcriptional regulator
MAEILIKRKDQITETAQNLFREKGYAGTSMRDLAKAVGIEAASLYSHIKSKEEILSGICFRIANDFKDALYPVIVNEADAESKLREAVIAHIKVISRNQNATAVFFNEWRHLGEPDLSAFKARRHEYEDKFKDIIQKGIEAGSFSTHDINFTVKLIFSTLNGTHEWYKEGGKLSPQQIGQNISDFILNGLLVGKSH